MKRRHFLTLTGTTLGTTLAGCSAPDKDAEETTPRPDSGTVTSVATALPDGLTATVTVANKAADFSEEPLRVTVTLKNTSSDTEYWYGEAREAMFVGANAGPFFLYPTDYYNQDKYTYNSKNSVWVAKERFAQTMEYRMVNLKPGQSETQELVLLHQKAKHEESITPYPSELAFSAEFNTAKSEKELLDTNSGMKSKIGFTLIPPN